MKIIGPLSVLNYLQRNVHEGILIKDGRALEHISQVDTVVFDKTGTLTLEQPHVSRGQDRTEDPFRSDQNRRNQLSKQTEHVFCQPNRSPKWGIERQQQTDLHGCPVARSAISVKPYPSTNGPYSI